MAIETDVRLNLATALSSPSAPPSSHPERLLMHRMYTVAMARHELRQLLPRQVFTIVTHARFASRKF